MIARLQKRSSLIVVSIVGVIIAIRISSFVFTHSTGKVDPHINLTADKTKEITEKQRQQQLAAFFAVANGEVSRTEERIREAIALATVTALFAANESLNGRSPTDVTSLLKGISNSRLIPPGLQLQDSDGSLTSAHSKVLVRYRIEPIAIEIVSLGKVCLDGPMLVFRVLSSEAKAKHQEQTILYIATTLELTKVPSPFAAEAELFAFGFEPEHLPGAKLSHP